MTWDPQAAKNWQKYDLNQILRMYPESLKEVPLMLNCELDDEYGFAAETTILHETLNELGIAHHFEIYSDLKSTLYAHAFGCVYQILPGIRFCLQHIT